MNANGPAESPPRPQPPVLGECCGRCCERCVWVYYEEALARWEREYAAINAAGSVRNNE